MRIANHEVTVSTLAHTAVFAALCLLALVLGMRSYGTAREAWRRGEIITALAESADVSNTALVEQGLAACDALSAADASRSAPLLYKGCLLSKLGKFAEAKSAFEQAAAERGATPEEKSIALAAAASSTALDGAKDGRPAKLDEALQLAEKALGAAATPDALATEAILSSWQTGAPDAQLETLIEKALAASPAPAAPALEQLYRLQGTLQLRAKKPVEARDAVARVKAINPFNTQVGEVARNAQLSAIVDTSLDPVARRAQIEQVSATAPGFGAHRTDALLAVALAWHTFANAPDYLAPEGPFFKAKTVLNQLLQSSPKDARAYRMLAGFLEERLDLYARELSVPISGLNREAPHGSMWDISEKKPDEYSKDDLERLSKIRQLATDEEAVWQRLTEQTTDKKERVDARMRQLLALRRQFWATRNVESAWRDALLNKALSVAQDLAALDETGKGHWLLALVQLDKDNLGAAYAALLESRKRGFKSPEADKLAAQFQTASELLDFGPVPTERQFGARVIRATLRVPEGAVLSKVRLEVDGKEVPKTVVNTQVFSLLDDSHMSGAAHSIKLSADSGNGMITFPEFSLNVDKDPPTWQLTPPATEPNPAQLWQVELKDASGIDWAKLQVGIRASKTQSVIMSDMLLIKEGRYTRSLTAAKVKSGDAVSASPFAVAPPNSLPAGEYKFWVEVPDTLGNVLKDEKSFTVK